MQPIPLTDTLSVAAQIEAEDLRALAAQGFRSIVNNRPDGEAPQQPPSAALAALAADLGLAYRHLPVISGQLHDADADAFARLLADLPAPVLAFCRTGTRSTMLWALGAVRHRPVDDVLRATAAAGYDFEALRPRLQQVALR
jgi:uncharacterized protein (TIGR01244 family)